MQGIISNTYASSLFRRAKLQSHQQAFSKYYFHSISSTLNPLEVCQSLYETMQTISNLYCMLIEFIVQHYHHPESDFGKKSMIECFYRLIYIDGYRIVKQKQHLSISLSPFLFS